MDFRACCRGAGLLLLFVQVTANAGTNRWTESGPEASNIFRVEFAAGGNSTVFARGGDKFWKSIDAGATWTTIHANNTYDFPFALDRSNPQAMLVAGPSGPVLHSTDGGASFTPNSALWSPYALAFGTDGVAYASVSFAPHVRRSNNGGVAWTTMPQTDLPTAGTSSNLVPVPYAIAVDPGNSNTVYLGYRHPDFSGIYRTTNGGTNWTSSAGLLGISVNSIAIDPATPARLFVATPVGLYRSIDAGANWSRVPDPTGTGVATIDLASVAVDPSQSQVIYAGGAQRGELFRSADGGATWERRDSGIVASRINSIAPRPGASGEILAATSHTLYRTTDGGVTWMPSARGIRASNISAIDNASKLRVGLFDGGVYESNDGDTWTPINNAALRARVPTQKFSPVIEIRDGARLFVSLEQDGVFASTDSGTTWLAQPPSFNPLNRYVWGGFITASGAGPVHYAGTSSGVYKTSNDGDTWQWAGGGITMPVVMAMAKNTDGSHLYAGTFNGGVFKSTDGALGWSPVNNGLSNLEIRSLAYDTSGSDALIVGSNNGLFVTRDAGVTYARLADPPTGGQPSIDAVLIEDFLNGAIYVGAHGRVYRSVDRGQSWEELSTDNPRSTFRRITRLASDGPGVIYAGAVYSGLHKFTVSPDMELLTQAPTPGDFPVGTEFAWRVQMRNNGPHPSTFSGFTWQLPANADVIDPVASRGQCSVSVSRTLRCDFGVLQNNEMAEANMTVRGISGGAINIQARAAAAEIDGDASNDTFSNAGVRIVEQADLNVALSASVATVNSSEAFDYVLTVRNDGTTIVTGAEFETTFDARDSYTSTDAPTAGCVGVPAGVLRCPLPPIAAGQSVTYRWTVTPVPGGPRTASAVARINAANSTEVDTGDNSAAASLTVTAANDLAAQLTRSVATVTRDNEFNYVITATNYGLIDAAGVSARLTLGTQVSFVSATGATCTAAATVVTCDMGTLAAGASNSGTITVRAIAAGTATAEAQVSGSNTDPFVGNNSATASVTITDPPPPPPPPSSGGGGGGSNSLWMLALLLLRCWPGKGKPHQ